MNKIEKKPIFIHIPKTGGQSITYSILRYIPELKHYHRNVKYYSDALRCHSYIFTFIRNPFDRILSAYIYLKQGIANPVENDFGLTLCNDFASFVKKDLLIQKDYHHFLPMTYWLDDRVDFIGRFESLQKDYDTLCNKLNIPTQILPIRNKSNHQNYREYYDDKTRQIIEQIYHVDISRFNYTF